MNSRFATLAARAASAEARGTELPIVLVGSSTTAGSGASNPGASYAAVLAALISARLPRAAVLNLGQPGTTATTYLPDRRVSRITKLDPAAVIHMVGSNDYARLVPPAAYGATMRDRLDRLDAGIGLPCQHVLIQTFARVDVTEPVAPWAAYGEELHALTEGHPHRVVLDVSDAFTAVGVGFGGSDPLDLIGPDGIHMGDAGHRLMAELVWSQLG